MGSPVWDQLMLSRNQELLQDFKCDCLTAYSPHIHTHTHTGREREREREKVPSERLYSPLGEERGLDMWGLVASVSQH